MAYIVENDIVVAAITRQLDAMPGEYRLISIENINIFPMLALNSHMSVRIDIIHTYRRNNTNKWESRLIQEVNIKHMKKMRWKKAKKAEAVFSYEEYIMQSTTVAAEAMLKRKPVELY